MKTLKETFPGLRCAAGDIAKFHAAATVGLFSLLLSSGEIEHFTPTDKRAFAQWLYKHKIKDVQSELLEGEVLS